MFLVLFVFLTQISWFLCLMPCFMLRSIFPRAFMFRSTCLGFYAMFFCVLRLIVFQVDDQGYMFTCLFNVIGYDFAWIYAFMRFLSCFMLRSASVHVYVLGFMFYNVYVLGFMFYHVYVLNFYMFTCIFQCLCIQIYFFACLCAWIYVLYMLFTFFHVLVCSMPYSCAQTQALFVMPCAIVALLLHHLSFLCFGLMVRTRSRPYGLCHRPCTKAHIKGFGSSLFACLCSLASMLHACVSLSSSKLCHV